MSTDPAPVTDGPATTPARRSKGTVIVSSVASDSHTWNLVFLQLLIEELGYTVVNLGACVPDGVLAAECRERNPDLIVLSTVNGHGYQDGMRVIQRLRATEGLAATPTVIGGKLVTELVDGAPLDELVAAGFDGVFQDGVSSPDEFHHFMRALPGDRDQSRSLPVEHVEVGDLDDERVAV